MLQPPRLGSARPLCVCVVGREGESWILAGGVICAGIYPLSVRVCARWCELWLLLLVTHCAAARTRVATRTKSPSCCSCSFTFQGENRKTEAVFCSVQKLCSSDLQGEYLWDITMLQIRDILWGLLFTGCAGESTCLFLTIGGVEIKSWQFLSQQICWVEAEQHPPTSTGSGLEAGCCLSSNHSTHKHNEPKKFL